MAKKRVHEIAKARGLTSKEVIAALNQAGVEVKAAASSVDEDVALEALGANGGGSSAPAKTEASQAESGDDAPKSDGAGSGSEQATAKAGAQKSPVRPVRSDGGGPSQPAGKKRRRVVIDSQASRREQML